MPSISFGPFAVLFPVVIPLAVASKRVLLLGVAHVGTGNGAVYVGFISLIDKANVVNHPIG
jgi:hypothetical protein